MLEAHIKELRDKADAQADALLSPISPKPPRPQKQQKAKVVTTPGKPLKPLSPSQQANIGLQSPTLKSPSIRSTPGAHLRISSLKSPGAAAARRSSSTHHSIGTKAPQPAVKSRSASPSAAAGAGAAAAAATGPQESSNSARVAEIAASKGLTVTLPEFAAMSPSPSLSSAGSTADGAALLDLSPGSAVRDVPYLSGQQRDVGSSARAEAPGGDWVVVTKRGGKAAVTSSPEGIGRSAGSNRLGTGTAGVGLGSVKAGQAAAAAGKWTGGVLKAGISSRKQAEQEQEGAIVRQQQQGQQLGQAHAVGSAVSVPAAHSETACSQQEQQDEGEGVEEHGITSVARKLEAELGDGGAEEDQGLVGLNGEACWWWSEAQRCISAGCPAAQALDVQPQHVLGVGLDQLSTCQLEALEVRQRAQ